jgi:hypothetical protein
MTLRTLVTSMTLAAVVLAVAAFLPPAGTARAALGVAVTVGALVYLAAGFVPRTARLLAVVIAVRAGPVARCWAWPAPIEGRRAW